MSLSILEHSHTCCEIRMLQYRDCGALHVWGELAGPQRIFWV